MLKAGGVLPLWSYEHCQVVPDCDETIIKSIGLVEDCWPPERDLVLNRHADSRLLVTEIDVEQV